MATTNGAASGNGVERTSFPVLNGHPEPVHLDVGAGFTGCSLLHQLRKAGFKTKVVETGTTLGGVWYWNQYPGARVDSMYPVYSLSLPEEIQRYFAHVDKKLDLNKDMMFNTTVVAATFDETKNSWLVTCDNRKDFLTKFLVSGTGFSAKRYMPKWKGMDICEAQMCHSSFWADDMGVRGKKVAVIRNGATGVQIAQESAAVAKELTVFVRTPNYWIPMRQRPLTKEELKEDRLSFLDIYKLRRETYGEERKRLMEENWEMGGFAFMSRTYNNILTDPECNKPHYDFWRRKTLERIPDLKKAAILAPAQPPHPFGAKRLSLEQDYYEKMSLPNIKLVSLKESPIEEFVENGIKTADGTVYEADIIAIATGFDAVTGGINSIAITGLDGKRLLDKWEMGACTNLGISTAGFPNLFFTYGPQSPTAFSNGPSCIEIRCDWILQVLNKMREVGLERIDVKKRNEDAWKAQVNGFSERTLVHGVDTWYMGTNIPGKPKEALNYTGGIPAYAKALKTSFDNGFEGFTVQ